MRKSKQNLSLLFALCMVLCLAACSKQPEQSQASTPVRDTVILTQAREPTILASISKSQTLVNRDMIILSNLYNTPLYLNAKGVIEPCIAKAWDISSDGKVYTLTIRDDVYFHDGSKMTAEDVAFSLNTLKANQPNAATNQLTNIDYAEAPNNTTCIVYLSEPYAAFLNGLTARAAYVHSKAHYEVVGEAGYINSPIGTGPYKFVRKDPDGTIYLEAFDQYWESRPSIKNVVVKTIANTTTAFLALENSEVDVVNNADVNNADRIKPGSGLTWAYCPAATACHLKFSCWDEVATSDKNLRKAIAHAINRDDIILGVLNGYGMAAPFFVNLDYTCAPDPKDTIVNEYNPEKAKQYLAASGYSGQVLDCIVGAGSKEEAAAQIIQGQLDTIGIRMDIRSLDSTTLSAYSADSKTYGWNMIVTSSTSSQYDAHIISANYGTPNSGTMGRTRQDELMRLIGLESVEMDKVVRTDLIKQFLDIVAEEAYDVPLYYDVFAFAYNENLKGVVPHPSNFVEVVNWSWQ